MGKLEFESESLLYIEIENKITEFYEIGVPYSSNFMQLEVGVHSNYAIIASNGSIEFSAIVGNKKSEEGYIITINPKKIKIN